MNTDELIQAKLREKFWDCTTIAIAHRLQTIMDYDIVIVLSEGAVAEIGNPKELLDDPSSMFCKMKKSH
jgi:ATP-binding cassette subfamily C (CFTR/MRP) protein 1